jgi:DNA-directed RNA polymerase subunit RPC12/RpoP
LGIKDKYNRLLELHVGSLALIQGHTEAWRNGVPEGSFASTLMYDEDLEFFKVIDGVGNIQRSFGVDKVTEVAAKEEHGWLFKSSLLTVDYKSEDGNEYRLSFRTPTQGTAKNAKDWFDLIARKHKATSEVTTLLQTREKVPFSSVSEVLERHRLRATNVDAQDIIERIVTRRKIEGVIEGSQFVSKYGLQRETVRYDIVSKFEVSSSGAIVITCPKCGATLPLQGKDSNGNCKYCGTPYMVPRKILDLL